MDVIFMLATCFEIDGSFSRSRSGPDIYGDRSVSESRVRSSRITGNNCTGGRITSYSIADTGPMDHSYSESKTMGVGLPESNSFSTKTKSLLGKKVAGSISRTRNIVNLCNQLQTVPRKRHLLGETVITQVIDDANNF